MGSARLAISIQALAGRITSPTMGGEGRGMLKVRDHRNGDQMEFLGRLHSQGDTLPSALGPALGRVDGISGG